MEERVRAVAAAAEVATRCGLAVERTEVLSDSNKVMVRLEPCAVVARVAHRGQEVAAFEVDLARRLAAAGAPIAALAPRVPPRPHEADGFVVTLWTFHAGPPGPPPPTEVADALARLHGALRAIDVAAPHFTDRVAEAEALVAHPDRSPALAADDRALLLAALRTGRDAVLGAGAPEQLLHGEPHPGNVVRTADGLRFVDLETACRGPVAFDLAHVPAAIARRYPGADAALLDTCRGLVLAMVAAWRWDPDDRFPHGRAAGHELLAALRGGPPWPPLDVVMARAGVP